MLLSVDNLTKSYGSMVAVNEVSFDVKAGEVHGLCGHNGAGKSTVVKMLTGLVTPDSGRICRDGREVSLSSVRAAQLNGIALVDQELSIVPLLSVGENLFLGNVGKRGLRGGRVDKVRARELLDLVGLRDVEPGDATEALSLGQRQLLEIARALGRDANLLILDEPTATLGNVDIEHVFDAVRGVTAAGCGVIYVSHRLDEVMELCGRVTVMRDGRKVKTVERDKLTGRGLVEMMLGEVPERPNEPRALTSTAEAVMEIDGLTSGTRVSDFHLRAQRGTIYALAGQVGSGATDVVRALGGLAPDASGRVVIDGRQGKLGSPRDARNNGIAYVSGDRKSEGLFLGISIQENLTATRLKEFSSYGFLNVRSLRQNARRLCQIIGLNSARLNEPVERLSGGNQQKVLIGRFLEQTETRVLLLDEPTRGVDVGGRADIHNLVRTVAEAGAAVVFASTELDEVLDLADVVVVMRGGAVVSEKPRALVTSQQILEDMTHAKSEVK